MLKRLSKGSILFCLLNPFWGFILACFDLKKWYNGLVFVLFFAFYGYCFSYMDIRNDEYRIMLGFVQMDPNKTFIDVFNDYFAGKIPDLFLWIFRVIIRSFTADAKIFWFAGGLIMGLFCWLSLKRMAVQMQGYAPSRYIVLLMVMIFAMYPVSSLGAFRYSIVLWICIYSMLRYILDRKKIWIVALLFLPLIHYSFWSFFIFVILFRFFKVNKNLLFWIAVAVCIITVFLPAGILQKYTNLINLEEQSQIISHKANSYAGEEIYNRFSKSLTQNLLRVNLIVNRVFLLFFMFYIHRQWDRLSKTAYDEYLYRFVLYILTISYILSLFVAGERFLTISYIFLFYFLARIYLQNRTPVLRQYIIASTVFFSFYIAKMSWDLLISAKPALWYQNVVYLLMTE
jgi:hypothetical protein